MASMSLQSIRDVQAVSEFENCRIHRAIWSVRGRGQKSLFYAVNKSLDLDPPSRLNEVSLVGVLPDSFYGVDVNI